MANFSNKNIKRKRPKIRTEAKKNYGYVNFAEEERKIAYVEERTEAPETIVEVAEEIVEVTEEIVEETVVQEETPAEEATEEQTSDDEPEEIIEETEEAEQLDEVPLEMSEDEEQTALYEEGSLDGSEEEVEQLASISSEEVEEVVETVEEPAVEEVVETVEEPVVEEVVETVEEPVVEEVVETVEEPVVEEVVETVEEPIVEEVVETVEEPVVEEVVETVEETEEVEEESAEEEVEKEEKPKKDEFTLTAPANLDDILASICTKRARKLIYRPNEVVFSHTTTVLGTDKANEEKIKIKSILDAEIKQGVKLGYLDKFDGLKMSELKEEYENDIVYEYADQEFKRTGILLDGNKVKVYVYDWDMKACHHVGYIDDESAELVKPYILERDKYSFDINGIIVGGKYKKITKDEKTGKITVEKGNDGNLGLEIDINILNRKD